MSMDKKLSPNEVQNHLNSLNTPLDQHWVVRQSRISKQFKFKDFTSALKFMRDVASIAEQLNHHPDWSNSYNRVSIELTTHSVGGLSRLDFEMASRIEDAI